MAVFYCLKIFPLLLETTTSCATFNAKHEYVVHFTAGKQFKSRKAIEPGPHQKRAKHRP